MKTFTVWVFWLLVFIAVFSYFYWLIPNEVRIVKKTDTQWCFTSKSEKTFESQTQCIKVIYEK